MMGTAFQIVTIAAVVAGILASIAIAIQVILSIRADDAPRVSDEALLREHRRRVASERDYEKLVSDISKKVDEMAKELNATNNHNQGEHK